jgi:hypothetical protein
MVNAAKDTPRGTVIDMESYRTLSPAPEEAQTPQPIPSGPAGVVTAPCATQGRNGALSDADRLRLAKIRRNRNQGWMPTFDEFDFLLDALERITR